jgi:hypothetical protein
MVQSSGAIVSDDEITWSGTVASDEAITLIFVATYTSGDGQKVINTAWYSHTSISGSAETSFIPAESKSFVYIPLVLKKY